MQNNKLNLTARFKITAIACATGLVGIFCFFLFHYTPEAKQMADAPVAIDTRENADLIRSIASESTQDESVVEDEPQDEPFNEEEHDKELVLQTAVQEKQDMAAQSVISVYSGESQNVNNDHQTAEHATVDHTEKPRNFLDTASEPVKTSINDQPHQPYSRYEVKAGTLIPAILETSLNSDLPGKILAKVSQNVYDTVTGNHLLVPQGTTLLGTYDAQVAYGQERALIVWQRMIFPNGSSMQLEGQQGVDLAGHAGLHDKVNNHYMKLYGNAVMFSLLSTAGQLSQPKKSGDTISPQEMMFASVGQEMIQVNSQVIAKNLSIQPTIEIRAGTHFNVMLGQDLILHDVYHF